MQAIPLLGQTAAKADTTTQSTAQVDETRRESFETTFQRNAPRDGDRDAETPQILARREPSASERPEWSEPETPSGDSGDRQPLTADLDAPVEGTDALLTDSAEPGALLRPAPRDASVPVSSAPVDTAPPSPQATPTTPAPTTTATPATEDRANAPQPAADAPRAPRLGTNPVALPVKPTIQRDVSDEPQFPKTSGAAPILAKGDVPLGGPVPTGSSAKGETPGMQTGPEVQRAPPPQLGAAESDTQAGIRPAAGSRLAAAAGTSEQVTLQTSVRVGDAPAGDAGTRSSAEVPRPQPINGRTIDARAVPTEARGGAETADASRGDATVLRDAPSVGSLGRADVRPVSAPQALPDAPQIRVPGPSTAAPVAGADDAPDIARSNAQLASVAAASADALRVADAPRVEGRQPPRDQAVPADKPVPIRVANPVVARPTTDGAAPIAADTPLRVPAQTADAAKLGPQPVVAALGNAKEPAAVPAAAPAPEPGLTRGAPEAARPAPAAAAEVPRPQNMTVTAQVVSSQAAPDLGPAATAPATLSRPQPVPPQVTAEASAVTQGTASAPANPVSASVPAPAVGQIAQASAPRNAEAPRAAKERAAEASARAASTPTAEPAKAAPVRPGGAFGPKLEFQGQPIFAAFDSNPFADKSTALAAGEPTLGGASATGPAAPSGATPMTPDAPVARHMGQQLAAAAQNVTAPGTIEVSLRPEELGRVKLSLSIQDGAIMVSVLAERAETSELMRRHMDILAQEFRNQGYRDVSFDFGGGGQAQTGDGAPQEQSAGSGTAAEDGVEPIVAASAISLEGGVDLRL